MSEFEDLTSSANFEDRKLLSIIASIPEAFRLHGLWELDEDASDIQSSDDGYEFSNTSSGAEDEESEGTYVTHFGENERQRDGIGGKEDDDESGDNYENEDVDGNEDDGRDVPREDQEFEDGGSVNGGADDNEHGSQDEVTLFKVGMQDQLLCEDGLTEEEPEQCPNSILRGGMWAGRPNLNLEKYKMGFLSQLAQLCVRSRISCCGASRCVEAKVEMDNWAPGCNWVNFRQWAVVAMSCQAAMDDNQTRSRAHTHLARCATGCFNILKSCREKNGYITAFLDGEEEPIELLGVFNLIYWMAEIQSHLGTGCADFSQWDQNFLPLRYTMKPVQEAAEIVGGLGICTNRLWNLVNISDRKHGDLPEIAAEIYKHQRFLSQGDHDRCTASKCQGAQMDSTKIVQLHMCTLEPQAPKNAMHANSVSCTQVLFPVELLLSNLELGKSTAWLCGTRWEPRRLCSPEERYVALSHVWSDGTGVGGKEAGSVNACLFEFFSGIAHNLGCKGIWWDTISIPNDPKARSKALSVMHRNYAKAAYTVVHDRFLLNFPWSDDGGPCLALVLSTWFTRGWTALELAMSNRVKVLFKNPIDGTPVAKDLEADILAHTPRNASRAHWLATSLIRRLRKPIEHVGDLAAILAPRSTSWVRDRTIIATLLAGVPDPDTSKTESEMTRDILRYLGKIPCASLLHGKPTMFEKGGYSWSTSTLDELPVEAHWDSQFTDDTSRAELLEIDPLGAVWGSWSSRKVDGSDFANEIIEPYGDDLAAKLRVQLALEERSGLLALLQPPSSTGGKALLVYGEGPEVDYIGTVFVRHREQETKKWRVAEFQLGAQSNGGESTIDRKSILYPETTRTREDLGEWLSGQTENPSHWFANQNAVETSLPADLSTEALLKALEVKDKSATRVLIRNNVSLDPALLDFPGPKYIHSSSQWQRRKDHKVVLALALLADVYAENNLLPKAIYTYGCLFERPWAQLAATKTDPLFMNIQLSLGRAFLALERSYPGSTQYTEAANGLFGYILTVCKATGNYPAVGFKKRGVILRASPGSNSTLDGSENDPSQPPRVSGGHILHGKQAAWWFRLELNVITEMIVLAVGRYDFQSATELCKRVLGHFGKPIEDLEAFRPHWPDRRTQHFEDKDSRDEEAGAIYQRALKMLSSMFEKRHPLLSIFRLQLGVNYRLRCDFKQAEICLEHVMDIMGHPVQNAPQTAGPHDSCMQLSGIHVLVALTRYHLGKTYMELDQYKSAQEQLDMALKVIPAGLPESAELHCSIALALCRVHIDRDDVDLEKACGFASLVISIYRRYQAGAANFRLDWRILFEASLNMARAIHIAGGRGNLETAIGICGSIRQWTGEQNRFSGTGDLDEATLLSFHASLYEDFGDYESYDKAEDLRRQVCGIIGRLDGSTSLSYYKSQSTLAKTFEMAGNDFKYVLGNDVAERMFLEADKILPMVLKGFQTVLGEYASRTLRTYQRLGALSLALKDVERSKEYLEKAFQGYKKRYGMGNLQTSKAAYELGTAYYQSCKFTKAKEMFSAAYNGFKEDFERKKRRGKGPRFHRDITSAAIDLAETCVALGGPEYEAEAMEYYVQALDDLKMNSGVGAEDDIARVRLKQGNLFRQKKNFAAAEQLILGAHKHFSTKGSCEEGEGEVNETASELLGSLDRWETILRYAELLLDQQHHGLETCDGDPEELVRAAKFGLENVAGDRHPLSLQAALLLGEICLTDNCSGTCEGEGQLEDVVKRCSEVLPHGAPMTIKAMDLLIHHWARFNTKQTECEDMIKEKWEALKRGYGVDTAIAIMKITDPKRENLIWDIQVPDPEDYGFRYGQSSEFDDDTISLSSDESLQFWGEEEQPCNGEPRYDVPQQYVNMAQGTEAFMWQPDGPQYEFQQQPEYVSQPQYQSNPAWVQEEVPSLVQNAMELPFALLQGFTASLTSPFA